MNNPIVLNVKDHGFRGDLYACDSNHDKVIIVFIGSEGSLISAGLIAERFSELGCSALALYYFGGEGLPQQRAQIPMEFVEKALAYLKEYEDGRYKKMGTYGTSIGSMLALEAAILFPEISTVIVASPTHIVTEGFATRTKMTGNSFLTYRGKDIEFCSIPENMKMYAMFQTAYSTMKKGELEVEKIKGKLLFIASEKDEAWPAIESINKMEKRLENQHFVYEHRAIIYKDASHLAGITPNMKKHKLLQLIKFYFRQERKCRKACQEARKESEAEILNWITAW